MIIINIYIYIFHFLQDIGKAFDRFSLFKNLKVLLIEYTIRETLHSKQSLSQLENSYKFKIDVVPKVITFIQNHDSLEEMYFIDWPGVKKNVLHDLFEVANRKKIFLYIKEYE